MSRIPDYVWHHIVGINIIGEIHRFYDDGGSKKDIPHYVPSKRGFKLGIPPLLSPYPLFGLNSVKDFTKSIYVVEGQKCQQAMETLGLQCVTSILGASSAERSDWSPLAQAKRVILMPDNDEAGERYARDVYRILCTLDAKHLIKIKLFKFGGQNND